MAWGVTISNFVGNLNDGRPEAVRALVDINDVRISITSCMFNRRQMKSQVNKSENWRNIGVDQIGTCQVSGADNSCPNQNTPQYFLPKFVPLFSPWLNCSHTRTRSGAGNIHG